MVIIIIIIHFRGILTINERFIIYNTKTHVSIIITTIYMVYRGNNKNENKPVFNYY